MTQALLTVVIFVALLAMLPWLAKRFAQRRQGGVGAELASSKLISVLAVGPQQRVVTVEVGPAGARTWLVLGVTQQSITTLHTLAPVSAFAAEVALASSSAETGSHG
jgi:flagellar protein FliO/FliZ